MRGRFRVISLAVLAVAVVATIVVIVLNHRTKTTAGPFLGTTTTVPASTTGLPGSTRATTSTTVAATTTNPGQVGLDKTDLLERQQPFVQVLPHQTTHYKVDYKTSPTGGTISLEITLYAILNNASQLPAYQASLKQYKQEALDWIRSQQQDPAAFSITYKPPAAAGL